MKVLIIGLGSIAKKHIAALLAIDASVELFALRSGKNPEEVENVKNITSIAEAPEFDFAIIANPTALHAAAIKQLVNFKKPLFIEKPPFHNLQDANECLSLISKNNSKTYTAFNLRFLDCLLYLKNNIPLNKVQEVNVYCGSYLPSWRNNSDYKKNYSANAEMGGGVHLDLIHELDYVLWIFGKPQAVNTILRSKSKINIDAVDYANYRLTYDNFVVNIILNYYRRDTKRTCEILFDDATWNVDLIKNTILNSTNNNAVIFQSQQSVQDTYKAQISYFTEALINNNTLSNSLQESVETLKIALS